MQYQLKPFNRRVKQRLRELPASLRSEMLDILYDLRENPYPPYAEPLRNEYFGVWKIKVDGWRILYEVHEQDRYIQIDSIKPRDGKTYLSIFSVL